jgi:hypothetical protein
MTIHDDVQAALRGYMSETSGRYPRAIVVSPAVLRQLTNCPDAVTRMRTAFLTDGGPPCEFILYLGMWLLAAPGTRGYRLLAELPTGSAASALRTCSSWRGDPGRG